MQGEGGRESGRISHHTNSFATLFFCGFVWSNSNGQRTEYQGMILKYKSCTSQIFSLFSLHLDLGLPSPTHVYPAIPLMFNALPGSVTDHPSVSPGGSSSSQVTVFNYSSFHARPPCEVEGRRRRKNLQIRHKYLIPHHEKYKCESR